MRQKSGPAKEPADTGREDNARRVGTFRLKTRSASCWKDCVASTASPSSAVARGLSRTSISAGRTARAATSDEVKTCVARPAR